jgi:hypothetical protein
VKLAALGALLLIVACSAPLHSPSATPSPTITLSPSPSPTREPVVTVAPSATAVALVTVDVGDWVATCDGVDAPECEGVAGLFINNLAWSGSQVFDESGGRLVVRPRPQCPFVPDYEDDSFCWQATAFATDRQICMVVAHHLPSAPGTIRYGQVGGDDMSGRAVPIRGFPPCV